MSGEPLRLAFLGCGSVTRLHSRTLRRAHVQRWYASRDRARADRFSREQAGAGAFGSYQEAIDDPRIDAVLVATPPSTHLDLTLRALEAGKHVIVEKPPFLSTVELDRAGSAAARAGRQLLVAENYFYKPLTEAIRGALARGDIGEVKFVAINALKRQATGDWRDDRTLAGGGALFEGGIHWIDFMANLGLSATRAHAFRPGGGGPDTSVVVVVEYAEGAVGTLHYSWEIGSPMKGLRLSAIYGSEGTITFESNGVFMGIRGRRRRLGSPGLRDMLGYGAMFDDFLHALRTGGAPRYDLAKARRDLELIEEAYRSLDRR